MGNIHDSNPENANKITKVEDLLQATLSDAALQRVRVSQTSGNSALYPRQGVGSILVSILGERIRLEVLILSTSGLSTEYISASAVGQRVANNGTPPVLRDCHGDRAGESGGFGVLVADGGTDTKEPFHGGGIRGTNRDAVCDHLTCCHSSSGISFVGVHDARHRDVPAEEFLIGKRDDELGTGALSQTSRGGIIGPSLNELRGRIGRWRQRDSRQTGS